MLPLAAFLIICFFGGIAMRDSSLLKRSALLIVLIGVMVFMYFFLNML
jgi:hypothetical protein